MTGKRGPETHGRRPWTNHEIARLREILAADGTYVTAAAALYRSVNSVRKRAVCLGLRVSPQARAAQQRAMSTAKWQDPNYRQRQQAGCKRGWEGNEARRAATSERSKRVQAMQKCAEKTRDRRSEISRKALATRFKDHLAWCPPDYREERRRLIRNGHLPAAEADRIIRAKIDADREQSIEAKAAANGWSVDFQRQLERVAAGQARVVPALRLSRPASADMSLIGCTAAMAAGAAL